MFDFCFWLVANTERRLTRLIEDFLCPSQKASARFGSGIHSLPGAQITRAKTEQIMHIYVKWNSLGRGFVVDYIRLRLCSDLCSDHPFASGVGLRVGREEHNITEESTMMRKLRSRRLPLSELHIPPNGTCSAYKRRALA